MKYGISVKFMFYDATWPEVHQFASKQLPKYAYEFCRFFGPYLKSLSLKLTEIKCNFSEINVLLCHMTGSAPIDPQLKIFYRKKYNCLPNFKILTSYDKI